MVRIVSVNPRAATLLVAFQERERDFMESIRIRKQQPERLYRESCERYGQQGAEDLLTFKTAKRAEK